MFTFTIDIFIITLIILLGLFALLYNIFEPKLDKTEDQVLLWYNSHMNFTTERKFIILWRK